MNGNTCLYKFEFVNIHILETESKKYFLVVVMNKLTDQYPECDMPPVTMTPV